MFEEKVDIKNQLRFAIEKSKKITEKCGSRQLDIKEISDLQRYAEIIKNLTTTLTIMDGGGCNGCK